MAATTTTASDNVDHAAVIDITSDRSDEHTPLVNAASTTPNADTILVPSVARYRPTNLLRSLLIIEFLTMFIIWVVGQFLYRLPPTQTS